MLPPQKHLFTLPDGVHYLNCAYMGPMSMRTQETGMHAVTLKGAPHAITPADFYTGVDDLRASFARLINAPDPARIALIPAVSYGIATAVRNMSARAGGNIVVAGEQFPSNVYSWRRHALESGLELRMVSAPDGAERGRRWNERTLEAIDTRTAVVALPHVHWTDGTRFDLAAIGSRARDVDAMFVIDGTQSIGALPFDVQEIGADAVICAGYKWLLGPYGLGCAYFGTRFDDGVPLEENWITRRNSERFGDLVDYRDEYQPGAIRFDVGERSNFILVPMLSAAIDQLLEWQPAQIQTYCRALTAELIAEAPDLGFTIEEEGWRAAHLFGLRAPAGRDIDRVQHLLQERNVYVSRRGSALRIAPNIYNTPEDAAALLQVLRDAI